MNDMRRPAGITFLLAALAAATSAQCPPAPVTVGNEIDTMTPGMNFRRRQTARARLAIEWVCPVWTPPTGADRPAVVRRDEAFRFLAGSDPRPLLVLRECKLCLGSDAALLRSDLSNEKTLLLTRWFRCVKLPPQVLEPDHPLREVFPGDKPPHMFVALADGSEWTAFTGAQTQADLWAGMLKIVRRAYVAAPEPRLKEWQQLLAHFDHLDTTRGTLQDRLQREHQSNGAATALAKSLEQDLAKAKRQMDEALAKEAKLRDLGLRPPPPKAQAK